MVSKGKAVTRAWLNKIDAGLFLRDLFMADSLSSKSTGVSNNMNYSLADYS